MKKVPNFKGIKVSEEVVAIKVLSLRVKHRFHVFYQKGLEMVIYIKRYIKIHRYLKSSVK
jgi:hypothetical protein